MLKAGKMFFSWDSQNNYVVFKVRVFVKQMWGSLKKVKKLEKREEGKIQDRIFLPLLFK
jgi:hypothetical protein